MACIVPASFGGGDAFDISFTAGFGGSPGKHTVKFVNSAGSYTPPGFDLDSSMQVGITGMTRPQTMVSWTIEKGAGGNTLSVEFEDKGVIDLQRMAVLLNPIDAPAPPSTACIKVIGDIYYKALGAPNKTDKTTMVKGRSPTVTEGKREKKLANEDVFFTGSQLAGALAGNLGGGLSNALSSIGDLLQNGGVALDVVQSLAGKYGFSLYANSNGQVDAIDSAAGINIDGIAGNVGAGCNVLTVSEGSDIRNTEAVGGYATYLHDDEYEDDKKQSFTALDLLGLPIPNCDGNGIGLYDEDMDAVELTHLRRLLKVAVLSDKWQNWDGLSSYIHLKRLSCDVAAPDDGLDIGAGGADGEVVEGIIGGHAGGGE
jgi:hypothetical protein